MVNHAAVGTRSLTQRAGLLLGPASGLLLLLAVDLDPLQPAVTRMAAVALLMAVWWITDAIPLYATALLPMVLYPLLGILSGKATAPVYVNSTIFLFIGGFLIALSMERWRLHKRIALAIVRWIGGGPARLVLGFMVASAFLSMWISNTATAIMMVPIGLAIVSQMESRFAPADTHPFTLALMLGIAYACSLGGMATLVGTPPNLALVQIFAISFPTADPIHFGTWILMGLPLASVMLIIVWLLLTRVFCRAPTTLRVDRRIVDAERRQLGPMSFEERAVAMVFALTALLWVFREDLSLGFTTIPGWSRLAPYPELMDDGTVALTMALLLFLIPTRSQHAGTGTLADADTITTLPWNIVLLFGGGFALAKGFQESGLSTFIGGHVAGLAEVPPLLMIAAVCFGLTFLTELTSNTATTQMILPILAAMAVQLGIHPLLLMIPATLSASCAFMMPVATPPNAIIFGSGRIRIAEMARVGLAINLIGVVVITLFFVTVGAAVFGIELGSFPSWAVVAG